MRFRYHDAKTGKSEHRTVPGAQFPRLVPRHVLPKGFRRARRCTLDLENRFSGAISRMYFLRRSELRGATTGLVQQSVQIVASHDLTLFVSRLVQGHGGRAQEGQRGCRPRRWRSRCCVWHQHRLAMGHFHRRAAGHLPQVAPRVPIATPPA